jgi:ATP-dependent RNA/DNA helicase IGHMBP2
MPNQQYFKHLQQLLQLEHDADALQYQKLLEQKSVHARREAGVTWYPIIIKGSEPTIGDYLNIDIERPSQYTDSHVLRGGMPAVLFSQHNAQEHRIQGTIAVVKGNYLKLNTKVDELPNWLKQGKLGIDVLFDEASYKEMNEALKQASEIPEHQAPDLLKVLVGQSSPLAHQHLKVVLPHQQLNDGQRKAITNIIQQQQLAIVHGPPGTGKTTTIIAAIQELLKQGSPQILVTAPSNIAVDVLTDKLATLGIAVLRIGNPIRVTQTVQEHTLDNKIAEHPQRKQIKEWRKQSDEYIKMAHQYKRSFGKAEREQRKALFDEAHKLIKDMRQLEQYMSNDVIGQAQVIATTLVGTQHYSIKHLQYHTVIIDEAAQAIEPACWIPLLKAQKVILAGDHCQLPPTIKSEAAAKQGLEQSLMEKMVAAYPQCVTLLQQQYRMHQAIMQFSAAQFYNNQLIAWPGVAQQALIPKDAACCFVDTAGTGFEELAESTAISNTEEAVLCLKHLLLYLQQLQQQQVDTNKLSIALITPYKQQAITLQELVNNNSVLLALNKNITCNTVDSFQGQEKDIIYISTVRSNADNIIGFLKDTRRMNVAITRAKYKLVIVGDGATLSQHPFYDALITYVQSINGYCSAWEFMY